MRALQIEALHRSLNAIVAQPQNCPFLVNPTIELTNITTSPRSNGTYRGVF